MRTSLLVAVLNLFGIACFGLSSNTNSAVFTLDTVAPQITITTPNGGEMWYIGDTNNILWSVTDTNLTPNSLYLWYTLNGGSDYISLAEATANTSSYPWQMPETQSYNAKVRIQAADNFGNITQKASASAFSITYVPPDAPDNVQINVSNNLDAVITWQPVTETIYSTPITPDGYMVLFNETPYEDEQFFYYLGETATATTFTHYNVARRRAQMYYRVVAFKDFDGRLAEILTAAEQDPAQQLSLAEIKAKLQASYRGAK